MVKLNNEIDKIFSEAGLYEKICCLINKYRKQICISLSIIVVILLFSAGIVVIHNKKFEEMKKNYLSLSTIDSKLDFVKKYKSQPLCGMVLLELGDDAFKKSGFKAAAYYYDLAVKAFKENFLKNRAKISYAMSVLNLGDSATCIALLDQIVHDADVDVYFRASAIDKLINCLKINNDDAKISELIHYSEGLALSDNWKKRIEMSSR